MALNGLLPSPTPGMTMEVLGTLVGAAIQGQIVASAHTLKHCPTLNASAGQLGNGSGAEVIKSLVRSQDYLSHSVSRSSGGCAPKHGLCGVSRAGRSFSHRQVGGGQFSGPDCGWRTRVRRWKLLGHFFFFWILWTESISAGRFLRQPASEAKSFGFSKQSNSSEKF